jgi:hypothetical protein
MPWALLPVRLPRNWLGAGPGEGEAEPQSWAIPERQRAYGAP